MCASFDAFGGPTTQVLGTETGDGVVYSVSLKRVRYGSQSCDSIGHLQWNSHKIRTLKAGTVEKLVEHLAPWRDPVDVSYRTCFLCTYKTFTTSDVVLRLLIQRFQSMEPCSTDSIRDTADKTLVQNHIVSFVRHWLESYPLDFCDPPSHPLLSQLHTLTRTSPVLQRVLDNLQLNFETRDLVKRGRCGVSVDSGLGVPSEDSDPGDECDGCADAADDFDLCTLSPKQFAESLTAEDAEVFQRVTPRHCLEYVREPKNLENGSSVRECIQHFNQVSLIVIATVLGEPDFEGRGLKIARWIDNASECRAIKNFSSLTAVISGLQSSAVFRLKRSWSSVPSSKVSLFHELASLLAADGNHQTSRDLLNREGTAKYAEMTSPRKSKAVGTGMSGSVQGVVPYLGMYLTDLTMVHSAHGDLTEFGLVNFDKRRKLFELLAQLTLYQKSAGNYHYPSHPGLVRWLHSTPTLTQQESYLLSKSLEEDSLAPAPSYTAKTLLSPARLRSKLKYLFTAKGAVVSDSHAFTPPLQSHPSHITKQVSDSISCEHLERLDSVDGIARKFQRSTSLSPSIVRRYSEQPVERTRDTSRPHLLMSHVIKVAMTHNDHCNYKCMLVNDCERAGSVIERALRKFSVDESPSKFSLVQLVDDRRTVPIPSDANVYYALSSASETKNEVIRATLLLVKTS